MNEQLADNNILYEDMLPGGSHWSMLVRKGITLRLIDQKRRR